jgi:hypothetical protein
MFIRKESSGLDIRRASLARRLEAVGDIRRRDYSRARLVQGQAQTHRPALAKQTSPGQDAA